LIFEQVVGSENHFTALTLNNLAVLYHDLGKHTEADALFKRILATCEMGLWPNPLDVAL
jgi:tetratricopeptide repeat protein